MSEPAKPQKKLKYFNSEKWAKVRVAGREKYAWKWGLLAYGLPVGALATFIDFATEDVNIYAHMGFLAVMIPGSIWMGLRMGRGQFDRFEYQFLNFTYSEIRPDLSPPSVHPQPKQASDSSSAYTKECFVFLSKIGMFILYGIVIFFVFSTLVIIAESMHH